MADERIWTAGLVVIGDEILSGRTQDRNVAQIGAWLNLQGIRLAEVRICPDDMAAIAEAVNALKARNDYLFTTGGIGPTHDDITVDAIAAALGVGVVVHPKARSILEAYYASRGGITQARLRMARVPEGAELIENKLSGAPGIRLGNIFILAGVPHIATLMLEGLSGQLEGGRPLLSRVIGCWSPESEVADLLGETERAHRSCQIGSYPFFRDGRVGANFVIRSTEEGALEACAADLAARLEAAGCAIVADGI
jgi:molybdenum cofactor synthesis domain-containing protein